jgi:integrase
LRPPSETARRETHGQISTPRPSSSVFRSLVRGDPEPQPQPVNHAGLSRSARQADPAPRSASLSYENCLWGVVDRHLASVRVQHGSALAKTTRSVLSGLCALACRYDALATNPCRDVARISTKPKRPPTALTTDELRRLHHWLSSDEQSVQRDLPDLVLFLSATGLRIGEALAIQWADVDLDRKTVEVRGTVLRMRARGLIIKSSPKSAAGRRILELPPWAVTTLRQRRPNHVVEDDFASQQVFPAPSEVAYGTLPTL